MPLVPNLRRLRELAGLSREDLAAKAHVGRTTIIELELGRAAARPSTIRKLAAALACTPADLQQRSAQD